MANGDLKDVYDKIRDNAKAIGDIEGDIKAMKSEIHHLQENGKDLTAAVTALKEQSMLEDMSIWKRLMLVAGGAAVISTLVTSLLTGIALWYFRGLS